MKISLIFAIFFLITISVIAQNDQERFELLPENSLVFKFDSSASDLKNDNILLIINAQATNYDSLGMDRGAIDLKYYTRYGYLITDINSDSLANELLLKYPLKEDLLIISSYKDAKISANNRLDSGKKYLMIFTNGICDCFGQVSFK